MPEKGFKESGDTPLPPTPEEISESASDYAKRAYHGAITDILAMALGRDPADFGAGFTGWEKKHFIQLEEEIIKQMANELTDLRSKVESLRAENERLRNSK